MTPASEDRADGVVSISSFWRSPPIFLVMDRRPHAVNAVSPRDSETPLRCPVLEADLKMEPVAARTAAAVYGPLDDLEERCLEVAPAVAVALGSTR